MRKIAQIVLALTVVALATSIPTAGAGGTHKNRYSNTSQDPRTCLQSNGQPAGTIIYTGPVKLWPPNHKYNTGTVTITDEDAQDTWAAELQATHDQIDGDTGTEENGSGNTADDITPASATLTGPGEKSQVFNIRAERSGRFKEGRTYEIDYEVEFTDSDGDNSSEDATVCTGTFKITVPHDMRPSNR